MSDFEPNVLVSNTLKRIPRHIVFTFFSAIFVGLLTHLPFMVNVLPNHDSILHLVYDRHSAPEIARWFPLPGAISSSFNMPWVNLLFSIIYIAISACFVVSILKIKSIVYCTLIAAIMVTFPTVASTFSYFHMADKNFFGLMLACLAVWLAQRYKYGYIIAIIPITLSLATYQTFLAVVAGLMIMVLIFDILSTQLPWKATFFKGLRFLITLISSIVLFSLIAIILSPPGGLTAHQGIDQIGQVPSLTHLIRAIFTAYFRLVGFFLIDNRHFNAHVPYMETMFAISFLLCAVLIVKQCIRKGILKEPTKLILLLILIMLFPIAVNISYLFGPIWVHDLMIYGIVLVLVFLLGAIARFCIPPPPLPVR